MCVCPDVGKSVAPVLGVHSIRDQCHASCGRRGSRNTRIFTAEARLTFFTRGHSSLWPLLNPPAERPRVLNLGCALVIRDTPCCFGLCAGRLSPWALGQPTPNTRCAEPHSWPRYLDCMLRRVSRACTCLRSCTLTSRRFVTLIETTDSVISLTP